VGAKLYPAAEFKEAVGAGFRPDLSVDSTLGMMGAMMGMSEDEMQQHWVQQVIADATDWALCPSCGADIEPHLR